MSRKLRYASTLAVAASLITTLFSAEGSGVAAQTLEAQPAQIAEPAPQFTAQPVSQPRPAPAVDAAEDPASPSAPVDAQSLAQLVAQTSTPTQLSSELACLAGAIYFESKGETLA